MVEGLNAVEFENAIETVRGYGTDSLDVEAIAIYINGIRIRKVKVVDTWDGGERLVCLSNSYEETGDYEIDGEQYDELEPCIEQLNTICEQINYWY